MLHGFCSIQEVYFVFEICVPELIDRIVMVLAKLERFKIANVKITRKDPELKPDIIDIQAVTDSDTSDTGSELSNEEKDEMYQTMATCGQNLLRTGRTGLVFLPGEAEIDKMTKLVIDMGVTADEIFPLFSDLDPKKINDALTPLTTSRLVLSTSLAEMAMTIPDVDVVLDCGIGRFTNDNEVPESFDYLASATSITQREGRKGRAKPGCYCRFL